MTDIGAEVGQKMRSAIKAKLMELDCYVDDELPDYIMVMVANKRSKSQMNTDLQLFLAQKTAAFVDWLHIVLKKLKEVHVTNPDIYKKFSKRKLDSAGNVKVKKEKKEKKVKKELPDAPEEPKVKSLTDDLPISASKLAEIRKIVIIQEKANENKFNNPFPPEVKRTDASKNVKNRLGITVNSGSDDEDFINIKTDTDELFSKPETSSTALPRKIFVEEPERSFTPEPIKETEPETEKSVSTEQSSPESPRKHTRITFEGNKEDSPKRVSVLERLGKRRYQRDSSPDNKKKARQNFDMDDEIRGMRRNLLLSLKRKEQSKEKRIDKQDVRNKLDQKKLLLSKKLGVLSKIEVPKKDRPVPEPEIEETEDLKPNREVQSMVKLKPRTFPPNSKQANKNLLLKAVADAQRSVAQTRKVGSDKPDALFTKKYKDRKIEVTTNAKPETENYKIGIAEAEKCKLRTLLSDELEIETNNAKHQFIVTLDGLDKEKYKFTNEKSNEEDEADSFLTDTCRNKDGNSLNVRKRLQSASNKQDAHDEQQYDRNNTRDERLTNVKDRLQQKRTSYGKKDEHSFTEKRDGKYANAKDRVSKRLTPSPIIFAENETALKDVEVSAVKNKERCKYWPNCRQGAKCDYFHPISACKAFPLCKYGEQCVFIHPVCKFEASCTRRDCSYSHSGINNNMTAASVAPKAALQTCKYYPQCSNAHCPFFHPRPCKFGKFCKNQSECAFSHSFPPKNNLTWRSEKI